MLAVHMMYTSVSLDDRIFGQWHKPLAKPLEQKFSFSLEPKVIWRIQSNLDLNQTCLFQRKRERANDGEKLRIATT